MLCPCGSRWVSVSCCYDKTDGKFRKCVASIEPPNPKTGYAHSGCYLRGTNDCSSDISGEHYFSATILRQISEVQGVSGGVRVSGMPWLSKGQTQDLAISNLTANILCKRHNEALSPLDQEAGAFFAALKRIFDGINSRKTNRRLLLDLVSGAAIELWMLKVACGMYFSVASERGSRLSKTHSIDLTRVEKALFESVWDERGGLYFNGHDGSIVRSHDDVHFATLSDNEAKRLAGVRINLLGFEMDLVFDTTTTKPSDWTALTKRPSEIVFESVERTHHLLLSWPRGVPDRTLKFQAQST